MKLNFTFFILVFLIFSCKNQQKEITPKQETKSRIKNEDLKNVIPHLLDIHQLTFKDNPYYENVSRNPIFIKFLSTENHLYAHLSWMDCSHTSLYSFVEEVDSSNIQIFVEQNSYKPERYFDLNDLEALLEKGLQICEDWYFIACKFQNYKGKLILEKVSTFFDNSYEHNFFDRSDSAFLNENGILISEPEPEPDPIQPK